jgi:hypothetical protein
MQGSLAEVQDAKDFGSASADPGLKPAPRGMGRSGSLVLCSEDPGPRERLKDPGLETRQIRFAEAAKRKLRYWVGAPIPASEQIAKGLQRKTTGC